MGGVDRTHMISTVDLLPTILDAVGLEPTKSSDGRSFLPLLRGKAQEGRDAVFAAFHHIHGRDALPMRAVLTKESVYVFNPWSRGALPALPATQLVAIQPVRVLREGSAERAVCVGRAIMQYVLRTPRASLADGSVQVLLLAFAQPLRLTSRKSRLHGE